MGCNACENRKMMKAQDPEGWRDMEMGPVECEKHRGEAMPTDDVLERADRWATGELPGNEAHRLILDLSSSLRSARARGEGEMRLYLANALRQVLGPRPEWRTVDTAKARRVAL